MRRVPRQETKFWDVDQLIGISLCLAVANNGFAPEGCFLVLLFLFSSVNGLVFYPKPFPPIIPTTIISKVIYVIWYIQVFNQHNFRLGFEFSIKINVNRIILIFFKAEKAEILRIFICVIPPFFNVEYYHSLCNSMRIDNERFFDAIEF